MAAIAPAEVFPPGDFLREELEARGWSQVEFAEILGRPLKLVNEIIVGKKRITPETAKELGAALGTSAELWLNLEAAYRLRHSEPPAPRIARRAKLRSRCPLREMINRGWIEDSQNVDVLEAQVLRFFGIKTLEEHAPLAHAAKQSRYDGELTSAQEAWLFRVKRVAEGLPSVAYSEAGLRGALPRLRALLADPEEIRHVPRILAEVGVRYVIVERFPSSGIDGVCLWVDDDRTPVIGMSLRFDRIDNFWFVLRHEIEHVLRRDGTILDSNLDEAQEDLPEHERIANEAAAEFCVPAADMDDFMARVGPLYSDERIKGFALNISVHPGLVAGQLRRRLNRWDLFGKHLVKIRHIITQTAVTDGFGNALQVAV